MTSKTKTAGVTVTALAALALAGCGATTAAGGTTTTAKPTSPSTTSSTSVPREDPPPSTTQATTTTTTTPVGSAWSVRTVASVPQFDGAPVVPAGSGAFYLLRATGSSTSATMNLGAVNLSTGAEQTGPQVSQDSFLVTYGGALYVISPNGFNAPGQPQGPWTIRTVALGSMTLGTPVSIGQLGPTYGAYPGTVSFQPSGPHAGDLWAYVGGRLDLLDPSNGTVLESMGLPAGQGDDNVEASLDGTYVDVSLLTDSSSVAGEVVEFDASTGAVVAAHTKLYAVGTPGMTAVPGGLWVSYRGGMDGTSVHFAEPSLADDTPPVTGSPDETRPLPGYSVGMGEQAYDFGGVALITDIFGAGCMSSSGTSLVSTAPFPGGSWSSPGRSWYPFAGSGGTVFATEYPTTNADVSVVAVTLPAAC